MQREVKSLHGKTAGCPTDAHISSWPLPAQLREGNRTEPDRALAKAPSWGAAGLSPQHPNHCQMLLEQGLAKELHSTHISCTPEGPMLSKTAQLWQGHSFSEQTPTPLDNFMVNLCKSKVELSLKCTQRSPMFSNYKIFPMCRMQKYLMFLPSRGQYNTGLCYEAWLQAKSLQEQVTKAFIKKRKIHKASKSPGNTSLSVQVLSRASSANLNARQCNFSHTIKDSANKSIQV